MGWGVSRILMRAWCKFMVLVREGKLFMYMQLGCDLCVTGGMQMSSVEKSQNNVFVNCVF